MKYANTPKSKDFCLSKPTSEQPLQACAEHLRELGGVFSPTTLIQLIGWCEDEETPTKGIR